MRGHTNIKFIQHKSQIRNKTGNVRVKVTLRHISLKSLVVEKRLVFDVLKALIIQHGKSRLLSVACPALKYTYFFTVLRKRQDLRENVIEHEILVLIYFKTFFF